MRLFRAQVHMQVEILLSVEAFSRRDASIHLKNVQRKGSALAARPSMNKSDEILLILEYSNTANNTDSISHIDTLTGLVPTS